MFAPRRRRVHLLCWVRGTGHMLIDYGRGRRSGITSTRYHFVYVLRVYEGLLREEINGAYMARFAPKRDDILCEDAQPRHRNPAKKPPTVTQHHICHPTLSPNSPSAPSKPHSKPHRQPASSRTPNTLTPSRLRSGSQMVFPPIAITCLRLLIDSTSSRAFLGWCMADRRGLDLLRCWGCRRGFGCCAGTDGAKWG